MADWYQTVSKKMLVISMCTIMVFFAIFRKWTKTVGHAAVSESIRHAKLDRIRLR